MSDKLVLNVSKEARAALNKLAALKGCSIGEVLQKAIGTELYLTEKRNQGARILVEDIRGTTREIVPA